MDGQLWAGPRGADGGGRVMLTRVKKDRTFWQTEAVAPTTGAVAPLPLQKNFKNKPDARHNTCGLWRVLALLA